MSEETRPSTLHFAAQTVYTLYFYMYYSILQLSAILLYIFYNLLLIRTVKALDSCTVGCFILTQTINFTLCIAHFHPTFTLLFLLHTFLFLFFFNQTIKRWVDDLPFLVHHIFIFLVIFITVRVKWGFFLVLVLCLWFWFWNKMFKTISVIIVLDISVQNYNTL